MLTNFKTIQARIKYMKELEQRKEGGEFERLPKKEAQQARRTSLSASAARSAASAT